MTATLEHTSIPQGASLRLEVSAQFNITPFVARQRVNRYLLERVGNLLGSGEPELKVGTRLIWRVPVLYALPDRGILGEVGYLLLDAQTGELLVEESTPVEELRKNADRLIDA